MAKTYDRRFVGGHDLALKAWGAEGAAIEIDGHEMQKFADGADAREVYEHLGIVARQQPVAAPTPDHFEERQVLGATLTLAREPADGHYHVKQDGVTLWRGSSLRDGRRHLEETTMTAHRKPPRVTR